MQENNLFGNYWTEKFSDIYDSEDTFLEGWRSLPVYNGVFSDEDNSIRKIFYLLYSQYGNSHIANFDETQFKIKLWTTVFTYGPVWEKKLEYQTKIRQLTDADLLQGARNIYNHSYNPSTLPTTSTTEELDTINDQNVTNFKKSKLEAYFQASSYLEQNFTKEFIDKFKNLFLKIVEPQEPLWYTNDEEDE